MSRLLLSAACLIGLSAWPAATLAAEPETAAAAVHPHTAAMAKLAPLMGDFTLSGTQNNPDGSVSTLVETRATGGPVLGRTALKLETVADPGNGYPVRTELTLGYDQYRDLYRIAVLDNSSGLLDIYEGTVEDGVLRVDNLRTDTYYMAGDMKVHFRLVWDLTDPVIDYRVDASVDGGEVWQPYMAMVLTPVESDG
ncbi:MAG: hypothetical protein WBF53_10670 [Litorimonas sp.]